MRISNLLRKEVPHDDPSVVSLPCPSLPILAGADATLASSIAEILGTAPQELIEAEKSAKIGCQSGLRIIGCV